MSESGPRIGLPVSKGGVPLPSNVRLYEIGINFLQEWFSTGTVIVATIMDGLPPGGQVRGVMLNRATESIGLLVEHENFERIIGLKGPPKATITIANPIGELDVLLTALESRERLSEQEALCKRIREILGLDTPRCASCSRVASESEEDESEEQPDLIPMQCCAVRICKPCIEKHNANARCPFCGSDVARAPV